jgi:hypothetical protein
MSEGREPLRDPVEAWGGFDDTLDDSVASTPPQQARRWLAGQRFVHGLLRQLNSGDASAKEQRVNAVLGRLSAAPGAGTSRWLAAAATLLLLGLGYLLLPASSPTAEAAVVRASKLLEQDVDRRFLLTIQSPDNKPPRPQRLEFTLTSRPGMHFLIEGNGSFGKLRAGCDGAQVWYVPPIRNMPVMSRPLAEAQRLLAMAGDVLDLGYLDVQGILQRLPQGFELQNVGTERGAHGERLQRVNAVARPGQAPYLVSVVLLCDMDTGMVMRIDGEGRSRRGERVIATFDYQGTVTLPDGAYDKPK